MAIKGLAKSINSIFKNRSRTPPQAAIKSSSAPLISSNKEDELRQVFRFLDTNNDGKVSSEELTAYFASIGESITLDDVQKIIKDLSNSKDASSESMMLMMGFEDFARVVEMSEDEDDCKGLMRQVFEVYEVEKGSGFITPEGLRQVLRRLGDVKTTVEDCKGMIRAFDVDGNGVLDFDEFYKMMI